VSTAGGSWDTYAYAETGNAGPHAVTGYLSWTYGYDQNGNMTSRTKTGQADTASFDWNNRLAVYAWNPSGTANDVTTTMVYDADGTRVARIETGGDTTHYVGGIFEVTNPAGSSTSRSYYSFNGQTVGTATGRPGPGSAASCSPTTSAPTPSKSTRRRGRCLSSTTCPTGTSVAARATGWARTGPTPDRPPTRRPA
jgi:YD repeat-containing protein